MVNALTLQHVQVVPLRHPPFRIGPGFPALRDCGVVLLEQGLHCQKPVRKTHDTQEQLQWPVRFNEKVAKSS